MKKLLLLFVLVAGMATAQSTIVKSDITFVGPAGYNVSNGNTSPIQGSFLATDGSEVLVVATAINGGVKEYMIKDFITSGNKYFQWQYENKTGDGSHVASIKSSIGGIRGYRMSRVVNGKLVMITSFSLSDKKALKSALTTIINVDKNN